MTYEPDDITQVRLPLTSLVLLVALPAALIPVLQFLSVLAAGNGANAAEGAAHTLSLAAQPGSVIAGSIVGLLVAYVIGGRKAMFLAVLSIVVAVVAMLAIGSPLTFRWGRTALNLGAGALLVLPILLLGHYGSHRQIAAGMPGLILGPFILVALVGLLTRPETEDRIAALTDLAGLEAIEPLGWLAIVFTVLLVLALLRAMGRIRGGRPNALFSAELRADARDALGFILTGPQIYALLIAMAFTGHAAATYLDDFARKSPLEGFGIGSTIAATICLGFGGFLIARIFGPRRRQHVLATTIVFLLITTGLMAGTDIMFAPTADAPGIFVWPYTQGQLVLLVLTCAAMAMLGASFAAIWLSIVEVGIDALATILLITVLVARIVAPAVMPLLPIPGMWLATALLGAALVLVALGTMFARRTPKAAAAAPSEDFIWSAPDETAEPNETAVPEFDAEPDIEPDVDAEPAEQDEPVFEADPVDRAVAPITPDIEPAPAPPDEPAVRSSPDTPPAPARHSGGLPWRRKRARRDASAKPTTQPRERMEPPQRKEPATRTAPPASDRPDPQRNATMEPMPPAGPNSDSRHEAVQDTHIDWAKLGATVVEDDLLQQNEATPPQTSVPENNRQVEPRNRPTVERGADAIDDADVTDEPVPPPPHTSKTLIQRAEPTFKRHDSTIFDFDRLRENTRGPDEAKDQPDEEKE